MKRKPLHIDWDELEAAFENRSEDLVHYHDLVTGEVVLEGQGEEAPADGDDVISFTGLARYVPSISLVNGYNLFSAFGICSDGLLYGGILVEWVSYSHYEIGPDEGLISLYSSYSLPLRTWVLNPSTETYRSILEIIQNNLPPTPNADSKISWLHSPFALILGIAILNLGFLLPAIWGFAHDQAWGWAYALAAFLLVQIISDRIITTFDGSGRYPAQQKRQI